MQLDHLIARQAERSPDAQAFRFGQQALTYRELDQAAACLAGWLQSNGIGPGDRVGIWMNRSLNLPVAVFGVLKSGAAYVPIDPAAPSARVTAILDTCGADVMIADDTVPSAAFGERLRLVLGPDPRTLPGTRTVPFTQALMHAPAVEVTDRGPDDPSYILFTSGSTGRPKGFEHTHASALAYAEMAAEIYGLTADDRMGNHSPLHFDMSTFEYFAGPSRGAFTVLIPEPYTKMPASLSQLMADERLTVWYSVPFALLQLLEAGALDQRDLSALRWIVTGGEVMSPKHLRRLKEFLPQVRFSNSYGPAETNQITYHHFDAPDAGAASIPLGLPCPHTDLKIDENGELLAATSAMTTGYLNLPDQNARRFLDLRDDNGVERRYYRTGDKAWRDADGLYHLLGRDDWQVKVRGVRVELDEVERVLSAHPDVREAAALRSADGLSVIAFVTLANGALIDSETLSAHAAQHLSGPALPRRIHAISAFTRTLTGKIDRLSLQENVA